MLIKGHPQNIVTMLMFRYLVKSTEMFDFVPPVQAFELEQDFKINSKDVAILL